MALPDDHLSQPAPANTVETVMVKGSDEESETEDSEDDSSNDKIDERVNIAAPKAKVNSLSTSGDTLLISAACTGSLRTVNKLIAHGADVHQKDKDGRSAFYYAAICESIPVMKALIAHGALVDTVDNIGLTPLMTACLNGSQVVVQYLLSKGADINAINEDGNTALMIAATLAFPTIVQMLLDAGAHIIIANKDGKTALQLASTADVIKLLDANSAAMPDNWLSRRLRYMGVPEQTVRHCVRVLVQQEGFTTEETLRSLPWDAFTYEYLQGLGITALGTQQVLQSVYGQLYSLSPSREMRPSAPVNTAGDVAAPVFTTWLGFVSAQMLADLPFERFTCAYLRNVGINGLGLQHVLIALKVCLQGGQVVPLSVYGVAPISAVGRGTKRARLDSDSDADVE